MINPLYFRMHIFSKALYILFLNAALIILEMRKDSLLQYLTSVYNRVLVSLGPERQNGAKPSWNSKDFFLLLSIQQPFWRSKHSQKLTKIGMHARSGEKFYILQSFWISAYRHL